MVGSVNAFTVIFAWNKGLFISTYNVDNFGRKVDLDGLSTGAFLGGKEFEFVV